MNGSVGASKPLMEAEVPRSPEPPSWHGKLVHLAQELAWVSHCPDGQGCGMAWGGRNQLSASPSTVTLSTNLTSGPGPISYVSVYVMLMLVCFNMD